MKTGHYTGSALATCLSFSFLLGCSQEPAVSQSAPPSQPVTTEIILPPAPVVAPIAVTAPSADTNVVAAAQPAVIPENLSPGVAEIARLAQANLGEAVLVAYAEKLDIAGNPTADEILYLTDLGVSEPVITALLKRAKEQQAPLVQSAPAEPAAPAVVPPAPVVVSAPETVAVAEAAAQAPVAVTNVVVETQYVSAPAQPVTVNYFYENLAPYGNWVDVPDYGRCWQPTVVVSDPHWQPYCDRGRWVYTDHGWYWHSDYSWGWAAFHYGRWTRSSRHGWVWCPDTTWGPSWVSWRNNDDYCGWAPLPPTARYRSGAGFSYHDRSVGVSFEFGLTEDCYTFVPTRRFCDPTPYRHRLSPHDAGRIYGRTTVNNNYTVNNINQNIIIVNQGVAPGRVAAATGRPVPKAQVKADQHLTPVRSASGPTKGGKAPDQFLTPAKVSPADAGKPSFVKTPGPGHREPTEKAAPVKVSPTDTSKSPFIKTPAPGRGEPAEKLAPVKVLPANPGKAPFVRTPAPGKSPVAKTPTGQREPDQKIAPLPFSPGASPSVQKPADPLRPNTFPGEARRTTTYPTEAWVKPKTGTPTPTRSPQAQPIFKQPIVVNRPAPQFTAPAPAPVASPLPQSLTPVSPREGVTIRGSGKREDRSPVTKQPAPVMQVAVTAPEPPPVRQTAPVSPIFTPQPIAPPVISTPSVPAARRQPDQFLTPVPRSSPGIPRETSRPQGGGSQSLAPVVKSAPHSTPTPKSSPGPRVSGQPKSERGSTERISKEKKP